ncbi:(2Fe-2S)-binding protein [bacterium]|nr:(2Fe-2S)-binding protein [bacterium]
MPWLEIDGKPVEVPANLNLIEAARLLNVEIPHYCYHAGLTVVGSCRMCQVEVEIGGRKSIAIACNTKAADGMKVTTKSETVQKLRRSILEFYLQHHPLDCPICDDAGECDLQNYYMEHGLHDSRMPLEEKKHKHKVVEVGPHVVLDSERCVLCSRCVRFCREITGTDELGIFGHGRDAELLNAPGRKLDNDYSGCVVDLCPVGALTDKDFRFRRRVWYMKRTASICTGCSRGCNIFVDWETDRRYKDPVRRIQRLKPRYNEQVNEWWMCDQGRHGYSLVDSPDRLTVPKTNAQGNGHTPTVDEVIARATAKIEAAIEKHGASSIAVLASAASSHEDLFALRKLFVETLKVQNLDCTFSFEMKGKEDEILMRADLTPNRRGALELGIKPWGGEGQGGDDLLNAAVEGEFDVVIVVRHDLSSLLSERVLTKLRKNSGYILYLGTHHNGFAELADDVLPLAMWAERDGSYTNFQGRVQKTNHVFDPKGFALFEWEIWKKFGANFGVELSESSCFDLFNSIGRSVEAFSALTWDSLGAKGAMLNGVPEPPHRRIQTSRPLAAY